MSTKATAISRAADLVATPSLRAAEARRLERRAEREGRLAARRVERTDRDERAVEHAAHWLVVRNGALVATFFRADDAMLFEATLADLDLARAADGARCEVRGLDGRLLGGYAITAGRMLAMVEDRQFERRYRGARPDTSGRTRPRWRG